MLIPFLIFTKSCSRLLERRVSASQYNVDLVADGRGTKHCGNRERLITIIHDNIRNLPNNGLYLSASSALSCQRRSAR